MSLIKYAILIALTSFSIRYVYKTFINSNVSTLFHHSNRYPGKCRLVSGIDCGSEKISLSSDGLAFITSGFCKSCRKCSNIRGSLFVFDFLNPDSNVTKLEILDAKFDLDAFVPLGMDLLEDERSDVISLYVVNHDRIFGESIEVLSFDRNVPHQVKHIRHIAHKNFHYLNDIALLDVDKFYTTNFWMYPHLYPWIVEYFLPFLQSGNILFYNEGNVTIVEDNGGLFNGLALSKRKNQLVVNMFGAGSIRLYNRNPENGQLTFKSRIHVGYHPDNIHVDKQTGVLYVGALPNLFSYKLFKAGYWDYCSSLGMKIPPHDKHSKILDYGEDDIEEWAQNRSLRNTCFKISRFR